MVVPDPWPTLRAPADFARGASRSGPGRARPEDDRLFAGFRLDRRVLLRQPAGHRLRILFVGAADRLLRRHRCRRAVAKFGGGVPERRYARLAARSWVSSPQGSRNRLRTSTHVRRRLAANLVSGWGTPQVTDPVDCANESCSIVCMRPELTTISATRGNGVGMDRRLRIGVVVGRTTRRPGAAKTRAKCGGRTAEMSKIQWQRGRSTVTGHRRGQRPPRLAHAPAPR
ncbi:MAG: hypothetical protein V7603_3715 [Micromonosporaceae bacterium]